MVDTPYLIPLVGVTTIALLAILIIYIKKIKTKLKRFVLRGLG